MLLQLACCSYSLSFLVRVFSQGCIEPSEGMQLLLTAKCKMLLNIDCR